MTTKRPRRSEDPTPDRLAPGTQSQTLINHVLETLPTLEKELVVLTGFQRFGSPFAAFLLLPGIHAVDPDLVARFEVTYADSWKTIDQLISDELDGLGWSRALRELRKTHDIPDEVLDWNRDALLASIREIYTIIDLDGWHHAFLK